MFSLCVALPSLAKLVIACTDDVTGTYVDNLDAAVDTGIESAPDAAVDAPNDAGATPGPDASDEAVVCTVAPCATQIVAGQSHFCALLSDGAVRCWGDDTLGALGAGDAGADTDAGPSAVASLVNATSISSAGQTTCARLASGEVRCWGANTMGQLGASADAGLADNERHPTPTPVALPSSARRVDVGQGTICALLESGALSCWGANDTKQLGRADAGVVGAPTAIAIRGDASVTRAGSDRRSTYAIDDDGRLLAWGGLTGREGSLDPDPNPAALPTLSGVTNFGAAPAHVCAVANGSVHCWDTTGTPEYWSPSVAAPLCSGQKELALSPIPAPLPPNAGVAAQQVALSRTTTCARLSDGTVFCCGDDSAGQLGRSDDGGSSLTFVRAASSLEHAVQVATADKTTCLLLASGEVWCWGGNQHGELGQGSRDNDAHRIPTRVTF